MSRRSPLLLTLILLTSTAALSKGKAPSSPGNAPDMPDDLQIIGWSKDEQRFAVRTYDVGVEVDHHDEARLPRSDTRALILEGMLPARGRE